MIIRQNVWRIYSDVFSNLMGLVLLGGMGLMALFGGVFVEQFPSATIYRQICSSKGSVSKILEIGKIAIGSKGNRISQTLAPFECRISIPETAFKFSNNGYEIDNDATNMTNFCATIVGAIVLSRRTNGYVNIVGHASPTTIGGACAASGPFTSDEIPKGLNPVMRETLLRDAVSEKVKTKANGVLCNFDIASKRAIAVGRDCVGKIYRGIYDPISGGMSQDDVVRRINIVTRSSNDSDIQEITGCTNSSGGHDKLYCSRSVTVDVLPGGSVSY